MTTPAWAHGGEHHGGGWTFEPLVTSLLSLSVLTYGIGLCRMGRARDAIVPAWRIGSYIAAISLLIVALLSPFDARADSSFAWHMGQHLLLMIVAAPLLALANAHLVMLFAWPLRWRRRLGRAAVSVPGVKRGGYSKVAPWLAGVAFALGLWLWHAPTLYDAALESPTLHTLEHLTFLFSAAIFWRMVSTVGNRRLDPGSAILLVTLVGVQGNLMAALITLAPNPIYLHYQGAGALDDQQIAGMLMWVPAGLIYLASTAHAMWRLMDKNTGKFFSAAAQSAAWRQAERRSDLWQ
ncbi:cytochrome c oxidase assembly protein [Sphingomonas ginkgonis]|uniref:Cytochrome c oxidase assembly protein n=1 Tax=Sphingomonas ginkgonis TaxID=2315330 RepID=A0A3R9YN36_9SPHN|nr:cytochrome c oxidase assembly protein [Sphingomonas ginkgonis]RST31275.1 cytochrome c oxidase assembly protein [Sphingomonas ginkgonis]